MCACWKPGNDKLQLACPRRSSGLGCKHCTVAIAKSSLTMHAKLRLYMHTVSPTQTMAFEWLHERVSVSPLKAWLLQHHAAESPAQLTTAVEPCLQLWYGWRRCQQTGLQPEFVRCALLGPVSSPESSQHCQKAPALQLSRYRTDCTDLTLTRTVVYSCRF